MIFLDGDLFCLRGGGGGWGLRQLCMKSQEQGFFLQKKINDQVKYKRRFMFN